MLSQIGELGDQADIVVLLGLVLLALTGIAVCWGLLLRALGAFADRGLSPRRPGFATDNNWTPVPAPMPARDEPRHEPRLAVPAPPAPRQKFAPAANADAMAPSLARRREARQSRNSAPSAAPQAPLPSTAPGPAPTSPVHHVRLTQFPTPLRLLPVTAARPEWTSKSVESSLRDAGANELSHMTLRAAAPPNAESVRAFDYHLFGLPRVDEKGRRLPDWLIANIGDRGFVPRPTNARARRTI